jgi:crotonobetainyl-CoA:carnitine CoA-transferase CaiB-like acyl-CoA transferase
MAYGVLGVVGLSEKDERFATRDARVANWVELHDAIGRWTASGTTRACLAALDAAGAPAAEVRSTHEAVRDRERLDQGDTAQLVHPTLGPVDDLYGSGLPIRFSAATAGYDRPPPGLGEHNDLVLGGLLGKTADELAALRAEQVI